jgi:hypothetical protein
MHPYVMDSLLAMHRLGDRAAIDRYVAYLAILEAKDEQHARLAHSRGLKDLSDLFGLWREDARGWKEWREGSRRLE